MFEFQPDAGKLELRMEPSVAEPLNPYAAGQCAASLPPPRAMELDEPILLRGETNLQHEFLVMRTWNDRPTKWITRLLALLGVMSATCGLYRFWTTGARYDLLVAVGALLAALCLWFASWILLGLLFGTLALLGIPYHQSFCALVTNDGLRCRSSTGDVFRPWSCFSRMVSAGELIMLYGQGNQRSLPIVIFNIHWCACSSDEERLWSLMEAKFGGPAR